jgi:hypothetical protein
MADAPASTIGARMLPSLLFSSESSVNRSRHPGHCSIGWDPGNPVGNPCFTRYKVTLAPASCYYW